MMRLKNPNRTVRGSVISPRWDEAWVSRIEKAESEAGHAICGARSNAGEPCRMKAASANGRCAFHGGHDRIGAPEGNENATIHGLYSRRLQPCGTQCARWDSCPYASDEIANLPRGQRPTCPFEQEEYDRLVGYTDNLGTAIEPQSDVQDDSDRPKGPQGPPQPESHAALRDRHDLALLQVMVSRAGAAASSKGLTQEPKTERGAAKVSPEHSAFLRLTAEYRRFRAQLMREADAEARRNARSAPAPKSQPPKPQPPKPAPQKPKAQPASTLSPTQIKEELDFVRRLLKATERKPGEPPKPLPRDFVALLRGNSVTPEAKRRDAPPQRARSTDAL